MKKFGFKSAWHAAWMFVFKRKKFVRMINDYAKSEVDKKSDKVFALKLGNYLKRNNYVSNYGPNQIMVRVPVNREDIETIGVEKSYIPPLTEMDKEELKRELAYNLGKQLIEKNCVYIAHERGDYDRVSFIVNIFKYERE